jgi:hypothetical protein
VGYVIGQFHTVDPDIFMKNQTFEYTILTNPNGMFRVENDTLIVTYSYSSQLNMFFFLQLTRENDVEMCISQPDLCPHDYEQIDALLVRVRVDDNGQPSASQEFWIEILITDENDPPVNLQLNENTIKENSPIGTLIGSFSVQDEDLYQIQTFTITNENGSFMDETLFFIEENLLRLARSPDYEQEQFVVVSVQATDNGTFPKSVRSRRLSIFKKYDHFCIGYQ